jgi:hypothetical protein
MIDYSQILSQKYKGSEWTLNGDEYDGLTWLSETTKPTKKQLDDLWPEVKSAIESQMKARVTAKTTAEGKLAALGLTIDDLMALGL